mgnify:CR=1 FL=1
MAQKVIEFTVELTANKEIVINGRLWSRLHNNEVPVDEKTIQKNVTPEQQFFTICELKKILAKLEWVYEQTTTAYGESHNSLPGTLGGRRITPQ